MDKPNLNKPAFSIFPDAKDNIKENKCPVCKGDIREEDFKDRLSRKEHSTSGMCQKCQDTVFC